MSGARRRRLPAFRVLSRTACLAAVSVMLAPHGSAVSFVGSSTEAAPNVAVHAAIPRPEIKAAPSVFDTEQQMRLSQRMERWNPFIAEASKRFGVPPVWVRAVMQVESGGRTMLDENRPMLSSAGAMGLMQLMPATYAQMRRQYRLGADPYDPHDNILAGAAYLRWLRGKYGYPTMFAAYNDGPGNLQERLLGDGLLPPETRSYIGDIAAALKTSGGSRRNLARFTRPNGAPVLIDSTAVVSVRAAFPGEYAPCVRSVIAVGSIRQGVCESVVAVKAAIRAHGGAP
jgi:soluble lytic murein transglycosylase-like protein